MRRAPTGAGSYNDRGQRERFPFDRNTDEQSRTLLTIKPRVQGRSIEHPSILYLGGGRLKQLGGCELVPVIQALPKPLDSLGNKLVGHAEPGGHCPTEAGDGDQLGVSFRSPFATACSLGWVTSTRHQAVSAWDARRRSAKTPRNRGNYRAGLPSARGFSGRADWLAEREVQREPVSPPQIP